MPLFDEKPEVPEFTLFRSARECAGISVEEMAQAVDMQSWLYQRLEVHPGTMGLSTCFVLCDILHIARDKLTTALLAYLEKLDELGLVNPANLDED